MFDAPAGATTKHQNLIREFAVPTVENKAAPGKRKEQAPVPAVPEKTRRIIRAGVGFALVCAAAMSAPTLFNLAELVGFKRNLAWLLPACLDGYAGTSILFGSKVPAGHPARKAATKNARLALALTVFANGGYHLLTLAGKDMPHWLPTTLLVTVSSLPPFIVHRLLHLHALADGTGTETAEERQPTSGKPAKPAAVETATAVTGAGSPTAATAPGSGSAAAANTTANGSRPAPAPAKPGSQPAAVVVELTGSGRRSPDDWAALALPLWQEYVAGHNGTTPTAPVLADLLRTAHPDLLVPGSERSERNIRSATERLAETADVEPERAWAVNS